MLFVLDVGTSGMRGVLYDPAGGERMVCKAAYSPSYLEDGRVEQDPLTWAQALLSCCRQAAAYSRAHACAVEAVAYTSQRSSVLAVDRSGNPLCPAILWQDTRNRGLVEALAPQEPLLLRKTGARLNTVYAATKMTWLRKERPALYARAEKLCTVADYLNFQMTGRWVTDETYVCRTLLGDLRRCRWDPELLELFEVERDKLCEIVPPGGVTGSLSPAFARETGLPEGIPVLSAGGDQQCSALGLGVTEAGTLEITVGTGAFLLACADRLPAPVTGELVAERHAIPDKYALECSMPGCAALYNWAARTFFAAGPQDLSRVDRAVEEAPVGANGCLVLPYFQGRGTPDWNAAAKGAVLNLTLASTPGEICRAVLESIAYEIAENLELLGAAVPLPAQLRVDGGLSHFDAFDQILADACGRPVCRCLEDRHPTALGGFLSAGVTLGLFASHSEGYRTAMAHAALRRYPPRQAEGAIHRRRRQEMQEAYRALSAIPKSACLA